MTSSSNRQFPMARYFAAGLLLCTFAVGTFWRFSSWHDRINLDTFVRWGTEVEGHPWTLGVIMLVYVAGGLMVFVHAALLWATALTFSPLHAVIYAEAGSFTSAMVVYGLGRVLRQDVVERLAGTYAGRLAHSLGKKGILSLIILHWFPVAPFSVLNLMAGSTHVRLADYVIGTLIGMTPGILFVCLFGHQVIHTIHHPHWVNVLELGLFMGIGWLSIHQLHKRLEAHQLPFEKASIG